MSDSIQELSFKISGEVSDTSSIKALTSNLKELQSAVGSIDAQKLQSLSTALSSIAQLKDLKDVHISKSLPQRIEELGNSAGKIDDGSIAKLKRLSNAMSKLSSINLRTGGFNAIARLNESLKGLEDNQIAKLQTLKKALEDLQGFDMKSSGVSTSGGKGASTTGGEDLGINFKDFTTSPIDTLRNAFDQLKSKVTETNISVGSLAKKLGTLYLKGLGSLGKTALVSPFQKMGNAVKGATQSMSGLFSQMQRIATRMLLRKVISAITQGFKEGMQNAYEYSRIMGGQFATSMDSIASSSQYLTNSLGAMMTPIINAIAPAVDFLINKFVDLINVINQFLSALGGGGTYTVANYVAKSFGDVGKSANGANGSAKQLKKTLLGFDEINKLNDNSSGGGGGGGGGGGSGLDYSSMFSEMTIDSALKDFADQLRSAFSEARWEDLGELLGNKFNSIVEGIDFEDLGRKLGYGIKGVVSTVDSFLTVADMQMVGSKLADFVNGCFEEMLTKVNNGDFTGFYHLGHLISTAFTTLPDIIVGFVQTLNFGQVAKALSETIIGFFNGYSDWFDGINWGQLGSSLVDSLIDFVANIDLIGIAKAIINTLWKFIEAQFKLKFGAGGRLFELISELGKNVIKWVSDAISDVFGGDSGGIDTSLLKADAHMSVNVDLLRNGWTTVTGWIKDKYQGSALQKAIGLIKDGWKSVTDWIKTKFFGGDVKKDVGLSQNAWTSLQTWVLGYSGGIVTKAIGLVKDGWSNLQTWVNGYTGGAVNKYVGLIRNAWVTVSSWITSSYNGSNISKYVDLVKNGWSTVVEWAKKWLGGTLSLAVSLTGGTKKALGGAYYSGTWRDIPQYAGGGKPNYGTMFIAGESGAEIVGNVNGRTEVLNRSQIASAMYVAVGNAISRTLGATSYSNADAMYQMCEETRQQNMLLRQQNALLEEIADKDMTVEVTTDSIQQGMKRKNQRDGKSTFVLGV